MVREAGGSLESLAAGEGRGDIARLPHAAVTNFKGGSGKTTTAAHLAQYFALQGYRVLAIDLDPQASLSALFGYQPEFDVGPNETLYGAIRYDDEQLPLADVIRSTYFAGLDLVPGNLELMEFEHDTPRILAERRRPSDGMFFARVAGALSTVDEAYDIVVIDCPPQLGYLTLGALCAATGILITIHPQMLDVASMSQFLHMTANLLSVVREAGGNLQYDFLRYLVTRFRAERRSPSAGGGVSPLLIRRSGADPCHVEIHRCLRRRPDEADTL